MRAVTPPALLAVCAAAAIVARPATAAATPAQELADARAMFRAGNYRGAIPALNYLLYPSPRLSQPDDLAEAHLLLAASAFETGDRKLARREFEEALLLDRQLTLDPLLFSEATIDFFEDVRDDIAERERRDAEQRRLLEEKEALQRALDSLVVYETRPYYVNFIPFGAGQFQNDQRGKGLFFAVSQGVTGAVSAGIWLYLVGEYGLPGQVPPEDVDVARRLQQIEIGAGALCLGLMAWGVVDSLLNYKPRVRTESDPALLEELRRRKSKAPPEARLRLDPLFIPARGAGTGAGAGVSLTWEY